MQEVVPLIVIPLIAIALFFTVGFLMAFLSKKPTRRGERTYQDFNASFKWALRGTSRTLILIALWILFQGIVFTVRTLFGTSHR